MLKKIIPLALAAAFAVPTFAPIDNPIISKPIVAEAKAKSDIPKGKVKKLEIGTVTVYKFGKIKLHAYNTNDALSDEFYALESKDGVVLIESGAMKANVAEFNEYLKKLNKPLVAQLLSYHPNGYSMFDGDAKIYATAGALASWQEGGGVYALTQNFIQGFGADKVAGDLPEDASVVRVGQTITIAGMEFKILPTPDVEGNYAIEIPAINSVYRHMMGSNVHNILPSLDYITAEIADLENYQDKGYTLILTSHYPPEGQAAVAKKIDYLQTIRRLARTCKNKYEFITAVNNAFPDYQGANYLEMTAGFLF